MENKRKSLKHEINIKEKEELDALTDIFKEMILDTRIDKNIRKYYLKALKEKIM